MWVRFWLSELNLWHLLKLRTQKWEGFDLPSIFVMAMTGVEDHPSLLFFPLQTG